MSNSLGPDQARHSVGPDLGPNYLQNLSADDTLIDSFLFCLQDVMKKRQRRKKSAKVAILQMYVSIDNAADRQNFGA